MAKPVKFAHVVYSTRRFDQMIEWYQKVFEATVVYQNPMLAFLTYDDEHHRFAFINMSAFNPLSENAERSEVGVNHVAYTYANVGELLDTYARLKQDGIKPYWPVHHGVTLSFYYRDPDGNRMEFQVDCCETVEEANSFMLSDAFAANPIGIEIDPEALLDEYRSGRPMEKFLVQPEGPVSQIPVEHGIG
jgi:catechol-2,3-dioxygenase